MLIEKLRRRQTGLVLYGLVPPRLGTEAAAMQEIAQRQIARLQGHALDGLVLYDIQDEAERTAQERPFPYMATEDARAYARDHLATLPVPKIIYRAVGKYSPQAMQQFFEEANPQQELTVLVGAASRSQATSMSLAQAYALKKAVQPDLMLGGVVIPERHQSKGDEHLRVYDKMAQGCRFFVSQGVYNVHAALDFLSDYHYHGQRQGIAPAPIIFTLTPCGSPKTLNFMQWLGISIPRWMENELLHAEDILAQSTDYAWQNWQTLKAYAERKGLPVGVNIESVAVRKVEVEASIELLARVLRRPDIT
jgi:hypothetical protein